MTHAKKLSNDIKHRLRQEHGLTLTQLADENGWTLRDVSDVVRGIRFGYYGRGRDIAEKIIELTGLTPSPEGKQSAWEIKMSKSTQYDQYGFRKSATAFSDVLTPSNGKIV